MAPALPDDILHVLCEQLGDNEQFDALFNCACASRSLAVPALTNMYRVHHKSPIRGADQDEVAFKRSMRLLIVQKWSIMWKSIIASAVDATLFPYCRYIRALDFRDLENLLEDEQFTAKISDQFFDGPLKQFNKTNTITRPSGQKFERLDVKAIVNAIGEVVTQHTPMLETISGQLSSAALVHWAPRVSHLQELELWDGSALEDELVAASIHQNCPNFNSLMAFHWIGEDRDHKFAKFLSALRPNTLERLNTLNDVGAGAESFLALSAHRQTLKNLWICISDDSLPHLPLLAGCTALEEVRIEDVDGRTVLEDTQNDVFLETINWLKSCEKLHRISFVNLLSAAKLFTPLLLEHKIRMRSLEIDSYVLKDSRQFHQALVHQKDSLKYLSLSGDTDGMFRDDVDILVDSLAQLQQMEVLRLLLQEMFREEHLISVISKLSRLEELYINGLLLTDSLLQPVSKLNNLRSVVLAGISRFTFDGLSQYINQLGPGNQGIRVMIDMAEPETLIDDREVRILKVRLKDKVGGTLEYTLWRDPNISEFEGDSD
ncbi:hypothetical protein BU23DRAFT_498272 [Bimuria novae-zelandiae CBS 107.79]|uniref:F-box domain-containing protein n=1 Tax=Bimuria novae-zelandiae CBS 107.79 TaxID=1447943 RepID=A0A6A5VNN2_9PLEO|nr:hypothetical protein BU23DRAFT_498272 [Bimuria novae-zelandiae CBS 107.79]